MSSQPLASSGYPALLTNYLTRNGLQLGKKVGEGSFSKVRLCSRESESEGGGGAGDKAKPLIACKIISKLRGTGDFAKKFLPRELEIVRRLRHPNVIRVYDVVEIKTHAYLFMEFCSKGSLLDNLKENAHLQEPLAQGWFKQILAGVQYLHGLNIAHRDLKCENVLLTSDDNVKIADFGLARSCRERGKEILCSTFCGSAPYMAPEIITRAGPYNPKCSDIWSLGCILFVMLTGQVPFDVTNILQMVKKQEEGILYYPPHVDEVISDSAKSFIRSLLEPDVTKRVKIGDALSSPWLFASITPRIRFRKKDKSMTKVTNGN